MLNKFAIDYIALPRHSRRVVTHQTDDPVEAEEFLMHLLLSGSRILAIRHNGENLSGTPFDRMVKIAANRVASDLLRESLSIDSIQVKDRFGFIA